MSQNREAPAYQEYAAAWMAKIPYRTMSMQERGLLWSMRNECWVNFRLPARRDLLAKVLGVTEQLLDDSLPAVIAYFKESDGYIFSPELEDYRTYLEEQRAKKVTGGRRGAEITNNKKKEGKTRINKGDSANPTTDPSGMPTTKSQSPRRVKSGSLVKLSQVQTSQTQSLEKEESHDEWLSDYESASNQGSAIV
jgi:hypothetical protein